MLFSLYIYVKYAVTNLLQMVVLLNKKSFLLRQDIHTNIAVNNPFKMIVRMYIRYLSATRQNIHATYAITNLLLMIGLKRPLA